MITIQYLTTPLKQLIIGEHENKIILIDWVDRKNHEQFLTKFEKLYSCEINLGETKNLDRTKLQLLSYFKGKRTTFTIPYKLSGTKFQKEVWKTLLNIPYSTTQTYSDIALKCNYNNAIRAIATAIGQNPLAILIPCHRVIGKNGKLCGYAGGLETKEKLLLIEKGI